MSHMVFNFSGWMAAIQPNELEALEELNKDSSIISDEIAMEITDTSGLSAKASITFKQGSINWAGIVELLPPAWAGVEAMAALGGALGLVQLIQPAIRRILAKHINRVTRSNHSPSSMHTSVVLQSAPRPPTPSVPTPFMTEQVLSPVRSRDRVNLIGIAAIISSVALFVAAFALALSVLR